MMRPVSLAGDWAFAFTPGHDGVVPPASAFRASGLDAVIGDALAGVASLPAFWMMLGICLAVTFLTEITSNTATTASIPIHRPTSSGKGRRTLP